MFSIKYIHCSVYKKHLISIPYEKVFAEKHLLNVYKVTQETELWLEMFLTIYKLVEEMKVMLEIFF